MDETTDAPRILGLKPLAAVLIASTALVLGLEAPAMAHQVSVVAHKVDGSTIKAHTITGNRLKNDTLTGTQIKESTLGIVPRAKAATSLPALVWHQLTLKNSWSTYGQGYPYPSYAVDAQGIVHLRGAMQGGPASSVAFSFPSAILDPAVEAQYPVAANNAKLGLMTVVDSAFVPLDGPAPAGSVAGFTDLDGITFAAS